MTERRIYPRPPIVEALMEFRFTSRLSPEELADAMAAALGADYAGPREVHELVKAAADVGEERLSPQTSSAAHVHYLTSENRTRLLGCGAGFLSVHVLAPYPGWENFVEQAQRAVDALPGEVRSGGFEALTVRYIDRIALPPEGSLDEFLIGVPPRPAAMPANLRGFHVMTQTLDPKDETTATLVMANSPPGDDEHFVVVLDLSMRRALPCVGGSPCDWREVMEELHQKQREIFEESITDRARELFV